MPSATQGDGERAGAVSPSSDLSARLNEAEHLESLGRLASGIAHDFNNLLAVILSYSQFVADEVVTESGSHDIEQIRSAALRAAELTRQLLILGRKDITQPEAVDLNELIEDLRPLVAVTAGEGIDLVLENDAEPGTVFADRTQLERLVVTLAVNARDAMPRGGKLTLRTELVQVSEDEAAEKEPLLPGPHVRLSVIDTGTGMTEAVKARAFEPFFTTKPKKSGTGLGLATGRASIREAGGHIELVSAPGEGTTVIIMLPAVEGEVRDDPVDIEDLPVAEGRGEVVLLVEDDRSVRHVAARVLRTSGYIVVAAASGVEALTAQPPGDRPFDLLLIDVVLPGASGTDIARRLNALWPGAETLFMSGHAEEVIARYGLNPHAAGLLSKPFEPGQLLRAVHTALAASTA